MDCRTDYRVTLCLTSREALTLTALLEEFPSHREHPCWQLSIDMLDALNTAQERN